MNSITKKCEGCLASYDLEYTCSIKDYLLKLKFRNECPCSICLVKNMCKNSCSDFIKYVKYIEGFFIDYTDKKSYG